MGKKYVYVGMMNGVVKMGFPHRIDRLVPFEVDGLFDDLFSDDTLYLELKEDEAKVLAEALADAKDSVGERELVKAQFLASIQGAVDEKHKAWRKALDERMATADMAAAKEAAMAAYKEV